MIYIVIPPIPSSSNLASPGMNVIPVVIEIAMDSLSLSLSSILIDSPRLDNVECSLAVP